MRSYLVFLAVARLVSADESCAEADETTLLQGRLTAREADTEMQTQPPSLRNHNQQCWHRNQCAAQGGYCPSFCGSGRCCRRGFRARNDKERDECGATGTVGLGNMHTCQPAAYLRGSPDGSCPVGSVRVTAEDCPSLNGQSLSDGTALSNSHHRVDCAGHFTPGAGCFVNIHGNVYSTAWECPAAQTQSAYWDRSHMAVCAPITELVRGGADGSCPAGTTRVTSEDCPNMNGLSLSDGTALSNSRHRTDCAGHFTRGEGCFVNSDNNVYSTAPGCAEAEQLTPFWAARHFAVCVRNGAGASLLQEEQAVVQETVEEDEDFLEEEVDAELLAEESVTDWSTDSAGLPGAAQYIGCFTDNRQRDMGRWLGNRDNAATNTFEGCRAACNRRYLALQSGGECFCADRYATSGSYRRVADSECNTNSNQRCSSNSHNCGGHWRQAIYHNRAGYNFGAIGANSCPGGGNVGQAECLAAAQGLLARGQRQGRAHLVAGSWGWVPPGCSIQTHRTHGQNGDFAAHFNRGRGRNDGGYTPVCNSECRVLRNQDVVAGTFEHYGRDHGGAATDAACSAACTADPECTAWVRQPSSGRCWISRQSVVTFEADRDRNTGLRCA